MPRSPIIFTAAEAYFPAATQELRAAFPDATVDRLGPETGALAVDGAGIAGVADACRRLPLVFVRHLMQEAARLPASERETGRTPIPEAASAVLASRGDSAAIALQVWVDGAVPGVRADEVWRHVADALTRRGVAVARANRDETLSICVTPRGVALGINPRADALTDWPGGRVGLARPKDQISRAEFKLDELFQVFDPPLPAGGAALDLGASPGGWTRILRRRGFTVWAVDPAALDPRIIADPGVHHGRTTAGPFLAATDRTFDLVVNDIRMTPERSCELMVTAASRLRPGGLAVVTLKISPHAPLRTVRASLRILERAYRILHARQLFHNRNEVTVVAEKR